MYIIIIIINVIQDVADIDHSKFDCLIVAILTHGINGKLYSTDEKLIEVKEITSYVDNFCLYFPSVDFPYSCRYFDGDHCPSLIGKPKVFILQVHLYVFM